MKRTVDARGLACPRPVIETRKALRTMSAGRLEVIVDNEIALQNLEKMAKQLGLAYETETVQDDHHLMVIAAAGGIEKVPEATEAPPKRESGGEAVVVLSSQFMGTGDPVLGQLLMKSFVYALTELDKPPARIVLYNGGVKLAVTGSDSLPDLQKLAKQGTEIFCCGTCLDYYRLTDELGVGHVSNMYEIAEILLGADRLIQP